MNSQKILKHKINIKKMKKSLKINKKQIETFKVSDKTSLIFIDLHPLKSYSFTLG